MDWKEIVIYIHGISPKKKPQSHNPVYSRLHKLIRKELKKLGKESSWPSKPTGVEWGWMSKNPNQSMDKFLAKAQRWIGEKSQKAIKKQRDWALNPARLVTPGMRKMFLYGVADIFYYASEDGEKTIRKTVFSRILSELEKKNTSLENLSLTFICHSAGTVITHDFLYALFNTRKPSSSQAYIPLIKTARQKAKMGKIRLRRLYTIGSPITPFILRSNPMLEGFANGKTLNTKELGILPQDGLGDPRWVNFWDKDDIISFPVRPIYGNPKSIEDAYPDVSDRLSKAHTAYWKNKGVARRIAESY